MFLHCVQDSDIIGYYLLLQYCYLPQQVPPNGFPPGFLTLALTVVLLALPSLTCGVTLHVRPTSTNISCPTHPCQTLAEYAQDPGQYFSDSNLTLHFLPGNHTLGINLTITNISQLEIHGAVLPTRVVCDSHVGFAFSNIHRMSIDGLSFVSCARSGYTDHYKTYYGLHLLSVPMAEIIDCTFQDSYGTALGVVDSHVVLRGNRFLNNCRLCSIIEGVIIIWVVVLYVMEVVFCCKGVISISLAATV